MLRFTEGQNRLNIRSVSLVIEQGCLLVHREAQEDFWSLPGGRVEFFETSQETVVREMQEELGWHARAGDLQFYVENFFEYNAHRYHEISTYYPLTVEPEPKVLPYQPFQGIETDCELIFQWVPIAELEALHLLPTFLKNRLQKPLGATEHLTIDELPHE